MSRPARVATTLMALLGCAASLYGGLFVGFLSGGNLPRLAGYLWLGVPLLGALAAVTLWLRPRIAEIMLGLAALGWVAFDLIVFSWAGARRTAGPEMDLGGLIAFILISLIPAVPFLVAAFLLLRARRRVASQP
jgi:hypothetical protein